MCMINNDEREADEPGTLAFEVHVVAFGSPIVAHSLILGMQRKNAFLGLSGYRTVVQIDILLSAFRCHAEDAIPHHQVFVAH